MLCERMVHLALIQNGTCSVLPAHTYMVEEADAGGDLDLLGGYDVELERDADVGLVRFARDFCCPSCRHESKSSKCGVYTVAELGRYA